MAVPLGRAFLAVLTLSLILSCVGTCPEMGAKNKSIRLRQVHDLFARKLWFPHNSELPNDCAIYPPHYRSSCYPCMRKDCVRNHSRATS
ncbi:hypothetical protein BDM02DRAFT_3114747 [Thelephora ganbajun]|uniref:Uncharacterized protein n=1 Tax=Thelephora ganbajun TaxID=370292 RepID=A0ACB6ZHH4_THEGA|nr:hypothetical protein BDM02DRAFT_3114747 [Thelephora ganbajun]